MKTGGLFSAVAVLAILGGLVWWTNKHPSTPDKPKDTTTQKLVAVATNDDVTGLVIAKQSADPIALTKTGTKWAIVKPEPLPADQDAVGLVLGAIQTLTWDRVIDEHPASLDTFGLATPAMEVDITQKNGKTSKVYWGAETPAGNGSYIRLEGDPKVYTTPTFTKTGFDKTANDLRDKRMLTFDQDKLTSVVLTGKAGPLEFGKNAEGDWQITKPKPFRAESSQIDDLVRKLKDVKMDLPAAAAPKPLDTKDPNAEAAKQFASGEKLGIATVTDNTGTQTLELHKSKDKDGGIYAKSSAVTGIYKVTGDVGDAFTKAADDFRSKKIFEFGFTDPKKLEINGKAYQHTGDKWMSGAQQMDTGSLTDLFDKMRDFSATKFGEKTAGTQTLTIAITYGDKNKSEKATFFKDAASDTVSRDGDPTVYIVDPQNLADLEKAIAGIKPYQAPKDGKK